MVRTWSLYSILLLLGAAAMVATASPTLAQTNNAQCLVFKSSDGYQYVVDLRSNAPPRKEMSAPKVWSWPSPDQAFVVEYQQSNPTPDHSGQLSLRSNAALTEVMIAQFGTTLDMTYPYVEWATDGHAFMYQALNADGSEWLVQVGNDGTLLGKHALTQAPLTLVGWSADAAWFAYAEAVDAGIRVVFWSMKDGSTLNYQVELPKQIEYVDSNFQGAWSPKGAMFAIGAADELVILEVNGFPSQIVERQRFTVPYWTPESAGGIQIVWSPDGAFVGRVDAGAFNSDQDGYSDLISAFGIDGTEYRDITRAGYYLSFNTVDWLPGAQILMARYRAASYDLYVYDVNERKISKLMDGVDIFYSGGFGPPSPNTDVVWLLKRTESDGTFSVELYDREQRQQIPLVMKATHILAKLWRGDEIVVVYARGGSVSVALFTRDGKPLWMISQDEWSTWQAWGFIQDVYQSSDGRKLLFLLKQASGYAIGGVDLVTRRAFTLLEGATMQEAAKNFTVAAPVSVFNFTHHADRVAFVLAENPPRYDVTGTVVIASRTETLTTNVKGRIQTWSPDGQYLLVRTLQNQAVSPAQVYSVLTEHGRLIRQLTFQDQTVLTPAWMLCTTVQSSQRMNAGGAG